MGKIRRGVGCCFGVILEFFGYFLEFGWDWRTGVGRGNAIFEIRFLVHRVTRFGTK
jgi:hypothetical protein